MVELLEDLAKLLQLTAQRRVEEISRKAEMMAKQANNKHNKTLPNVQVPVDDRLAQMKARTAEIKALTHG